MTDETKEPARPWIQVGLGAAADIAVRCTRCNTDLRIKAGTPTQRFHTLIIGFEIDHAECQKT